MNLLNVGSDIRVTHVRDCEEFVVIHVVNICPHSIKREALGSVVVVNIKPVLVCDITESALMPSESPYRWESLITNKL